MSVDCTCNKLVFCFVMVLCQSARLIWHKPPQLFFPFLFLPTSHPTLWFFNFGSLEKVGEMVALVRNEKEIALLFLYLLVLNIYLVSRSFIVCMCVCVWYVCLIVEMYVWESVCWCMMLSFLLASRVFDIYLYYFQLPVAAFCRPGLARHSYWCCCRCSCFACRGSLYLINVMLSLS